MWKKSSGLNSFRRHCIYTLNKNINATCKMLVPCFMNCNKISQKYSIYTKLIFLSNCVHTCVYIPVSEYFSFAKIIHPPDRCGISRICLNSMIITQVHIVLETKGHAKMCSFVTQHNATYVSRFEGVCNWHADCRNVHLIYCQIIEPSFLYHKPPPTLNLAFGSLSIGPHNHMCVWNRVGKRLLMSTL
jgi:DNA-directed RNA polymerase subunit N (RpoN/RPB10)